MSRPTSTNTVRGSPVWAAKEDLLSSVPDIGSAISRTLIAELPELGTLDRKRIAALAGLAPVAAGKPRMVALIAVARKLLTILNAIVRDGVPWKARVPVAS